MELSMTGVAVSKKPVCATMSGMGTPAAPGASLAELLADLAAKLAFHQREEQRCAEQEAELRERKDFHATERERVSRTYDALRTSVAAAQEIAARPVATAAPVDLGTRSNPKLTRMIAHVLADLPPDAQLGARSVTAAINRRFGPHLRKPAHPERVSIALRRLSEAGKLHRLRKGKPHHEALYSRQPPAE
jgi:hypothetical protein